MNDAQTHKWKSATYISLVRSAWSLTIGWIIFLCSNGYGGCINTFLSLNIWKPICKLSYCIYLIHVFVQIYLIAQQRTPGYFMDLVFVSDAITFYFFRCDTCSLEFLLLISVALILGWFGFYNHSIIDMVSIIWTANKERRTVYEWAEVDRKHLVVKVTINLNAMQKNIK